jgi:hypothetical protein
MPTNAVTFAPDEIDMVWKEPYLTEGLNEKAMVMPRGVYRGFEVIPAGAALTITVVAALPKNDHLAIVETQTNYSLTIRRSTGNFNIDLTAYAAQTVYVTLYASYAIGSATAAFIRLFTAAEYAALTAAEQAELTVLCHVLVPGAGVIPASAIRFDARTYPWQSLSPNFLPWRELVRNGTFELGRTASGRDGAVPYWIPKPDVLPGNAAYFRRAVTDPATGLSCLEYYQDQAGSYSPGLRQYVMIPVVEGQRLVLSFQKKCITVPASVTSAAVVLRFVDATGAVLGSPITVPISLGSVDASYVSVVVHGVVPTGAVAISDVQVAVDTLSYAPGGTVIFRLDAVSLLLQASQAAQSQDYGLEAMNQFLHASRVVLKSGDPDPVGGFAGRELELGYIDPSFSGPAEGRVFGLPVNPSTNPLLLESPELYWGGVLDVGEYMSFDPARAQRPRLRAIRADFLIHPRTRIMELPPGALSGGYTVNVYRAWDGVFDERLEIVVNAVWNSGTNLWNKVTGGIAASRWFVNPLGMRSEVVAGATASWADTAWDPAPYQTASQGGWTLLARTLASNNGHLQILNPQTGGSTPSNPVGNSTQIAANTLYAKNIPKHYARITLDGVGGVSVDQDASFNIANVTLSPSTIGVTLQVAMNSVAYSVLCSCEAGVGLHVAKALPLTSLSYDIELYDATGALVSAATTAGVVYVTVFGRQ